MSSVDVIIIVDALGALASGDLGSNVYLIDTNKHVGSSNEGQEELYTACKDGQIVNWRLSAVSPDSDVNITGFTGQIITDKIANPTKQGIDGDTYWSARVETQGATGNYQYSVVVAIDGKPMQFDPYLKVSS